MKLIISETTVQDATIPIRWCLERKELEELKRREVKNPHLLLAIVHKEEEDRYLVPLDQMLAYIQFHRPGENRIMATVVWPSGMLELKKYFLGRDSNGKYEKNVLEYGRKIFFTEVTLVVPAELFAKEPPAWEKWWVNLWFETKPRDQCQYRKRRMIAYTIQPPLVFLVIIILSICRILAAGTLLFLGKRDVDLRPIIHPLSDSYHNSDVWREMGKSVFTYKKNGERQHWLITFFNPPVFLAFVATLIGISLIFPSLFPLTLLWRFLIGSLAAMVGIAVVVNALFAIISFLYSLFRPILIALKASAPVKKLWGEEWTKKRTEKRYAEEAEKRRLTEVEKSQQQAELEQLLICNGEFTPSLRALPKKKQTVYLRFQDLKAKVCKPYAR